MLDISTLKNDVVIIAKIITKVDKALDDGKITFGESLGLATEIPGIFKIIKSYKDAVAELKDLSKSELAELNAHFAQEFDIANDNAEAAVEEIVGVIVGIASAFLKLEN